ncbi:MAG: ABC transporter permease [Prevotella sp.]|nr:ABC transporter permease [Prevotella sp.]
MLYRTPIYGFCMVIFPIAVILFFTDIMHDGQPTEMPVGVVDLDNTSTTRSLIRRLDAFQTSRVVGHYSSVADARKAVQRNKIYAFLYIPAGTTDGLTSSRQPKISFYYSSTSITAGALLFRDLKTISTLGSAAVGQSVMTAKGMTPEQIRTFLQPITIDLHPIGNPWINYNVFLSVMLIPGILMLFIFLITAYSIGTELKFNTNKQLMKIADNDIYVAIMGKMLPQTLIFLIIFYGYLWYIYSCLGFPHQGGIWPILLLGFLAVISSQCFGLFIFGLFPSLRMSMSVCSLWAMLSFTTSGFTFPIFAMDGAVEAIAQLFPLRHYYMIYKTCVFNGFPLHMAWFHFMALGIFIVLPLFVIPRIRKAMLEYVYIP